MKEYSQGTFDTLPREIVNKLEELVVMSRLLGYSNGVVGNHILYITDTRDKGLIRLYFSLDHTNNQLTLLASARGQNVKLRYPFLIKNYTASEMYVIVAEHQKIIELIELFMRAI